jgi:hypothetical protein
MAVVATAMSARHGAAHGGARDEVCDGVLHPRKMRSAGRD